MKNLISPKVISKVVYNKTNNTTILYWNGTFEVDNKNMNEVSKILKEDSIHYEIIGKTQKDILDIDKKFKIEISELNKLNSYWFRNYFK